MFRVPTDIKAGRRLTINGTLYGSGERVKNADLEWLAGRGNSFRALLAKGVLYADPDPHARKGRVRPTTRSLPPKVLRALIVQEEAQDVPGAPTALATVASGPTSVQVSFTAGANTASNLEYKVGTGAWTALSPADTSSPVTVPVAEGATGTLRLRGVNVHGVGPQSESIAYSSVGPAAPVDLVATGGTDFVSIAFTAGAAGGAPITNYEYTLNDGVAWVAWDPADPESPVAIQPLPAGEYTVKLRAVTAVGVSEASEAVTATVTGS